MIHRMENQLSLILCSIGKNRSHRIICLVLGEKDLDCDVYYFDCTSTIVRSGANATWKRQNVEKTASGTIWSDWAVQKMQDGTSNPRISVTPHDVSTMARYQAGVLLPGQRGARKVEG